MDDRKPPESNAVRLRRDGEPDEEERRRLSRTIFASEDEVGTFSRGNLLLPPHKPPPDEPPAEPDPFFEQLQAPDHSATPGIPVGDRADTVAYFEKLGSQTAAESGCDCRPASDRVHAWKRSPSGRGQQAPAPCCLPRPSGDVGRADCQTDSLAA